MKKTGVGIIGCGKRIRQVLQGLFEINGEIEIKALNDPSEESIRETCGQFNIEPRIYADYQELTRDPDVDWVMVGSWNCFHLEHVKAAFEAGKHVFCEKPLATSLQDCLELYQSWKASDIQFMIGFTLRYSPHYQKIKETIDSGIIGSVVSLEFNETLDFNHGGYIMSGWRSRTEYAGTHLLEKCCHDVDVVNWLLGSRAARAASFGGLDIFKSENSGRVEQLGTDAESNKAFHSWGQSKDPFLNEKDIVDNQVAIVEYDNQVRATFHTNCCSGIPERRMYIIGEEGCLRSDAISGKIEYRKVGFDVEFIDISTTARGSHAGGDDFLCKCLLEAMRDQKTVPTGMADALTSAATCFGIDQAMNNGLVFDFGPVWSQVDNVSISLRTV